MNIVKIVPALIASAFLVACGGDDPDKLLSSAKDYLSKNDNKAAVIQIKNLLQKKPDSGEARYLLGTALLNTGDVAAAEIELGKARDLKYSEDQVIPQLAKALIAQGKFKKITDDLAKTELTVPAAKAEFQIVLSNAYAAQGLAELSNKALARALEAEPNNVNALIAQARRKAEGKDFVGAQASVEEIIAKYPQNVDALKLKAEILLFAKGDIPGSLAAYQKSIEAKPDYLVGYTGILNILLQQGKLEEAKKQIDAMKKVAPNHPQTKYFEAQYSYQAKDFKLAKEQVQQLLKVAPDNIKILQLAGAVEFQLNSFVQAEVYLSKVVQAAPELVAARRLLAVTYLRSGQAAKALGTLEPALGKDITDPDLLSVAGEVYLQNGDVKKAEEFFAKAAKLDPKDARKRTSLALTHLMGGNVDVAFGELQNIAASDSGVTADLALISAHLRRKDYEKALKAIDGLEKKQPTNPLAANLRGKTQLMLKDFAAARKSFEAALKINPAYFPAVSSLAALDLADKKPEEAKARFESVLASDPKNGQALMALAELRARAGGTKAEIVELLGKAVTANPTEIAPRLLQIDYLLRNKEIKQALSLAQSAVSAIPEKPELIDALGRVQLVSGDTNQAISSFNKVISLQPQTPQPYMRLAEAYMVDKNKDSAEQTLNKVLGLKPDYLEAQRALILMDINSEKFQRAVTTARTIQRQKPKAAIGYLLEGDIYATQKKWEDAMAAYQSGVKQTGAVELAVKSYAILVSLNRTAEAEKYASSWIKEHPKDVGFIFFQADEALAKKDYVTSEKLYSTVVQIQPNNGPAYNNLAWVTGVLKKDKAVAYAEKANALMPDQPAFIDTLAMLLLERNEVAKALDWQKKAIALQPDNPIFQLNLAKIYVKSGDKNQAKPILDNLAKLGDKFSSQSEVGDMLKSM